MKHSKKTFLTFILSFLCILGSSGAQAQETLSWNDCVKEAAKNNPTLISAEQNINQLKAAKNITKSNFFPQIDANAGYSKSKNNGSQSSNSYSYGASASQLLFDGFKTKNEVKAAAENVKGSQENYRYTSSSVRLRLRSAFVNLLRAQELITVTEEIVKLRQGNLKLIILRYESGLEHRGALLNAQADVAQANFTLDQAKRSLKLAQRQLNKEMGQKKFKAFNVQGDFTVTEEYPEEPDFDVIIENHPLLRQATVKKNAAAYGITSSYADFWPKLTGQAGAGKDGSRWPPDSSQWDIGLNVSWPLFEGGLRSAQVAQAKAVYKQREADEQNTHDQVLTTLEQTWLDLQDAIDAVGVQQQTLMAAEERARIAQAQYAIGFITYDNWSIIEDNLVSAKKSYVDTQANALLAEANWIQAKGENLEYAKQ